MELTLTNSTLLQVAAISARNTVEILDGGAKKKVREGLLWSSHRTACRTRCLLACASLMSRFRLGVYAPVSLYAGPHRLQSAVIVGDDTGTITCFESKRGAPTVRR